jgi:hypothetical protein
MLIQVAPLTLCAASTADAETIRAVNALIALRMYWDPSCIVTQTLDGRWRASRCDGGVVTAGSPAGLHRKLAQLAGGVPPLGRRPPGACQPSRVPFAWIPGLAGHAGIWS